MTYNMQSNEHIVEADLLVQNALDSLRASGMEASFDSGYCTSPVRQSAGVAMSNQQPAGASGLYMSNLLRSPFKVNTSSNSMHGNLSPIKTEPINVFSPFKDSSLSPFKLLNQSPSKGLGTYDWEKDLLSGFGESLLGVNEIPENVADVVDELLKSPQGKAFLQRIDSPLRNNPSVARRLQISPENNRNSGQRFQSLSGPSADIFSVSNVIKIEPLENDIDIEGYTEITDHMYGQSNSVYDNTLCAIDPNKMGATPSKPGITNVERAPVRKLSLKTSNRGNLASVFVKTEPNIPIEQQLQTCPSKERLQFARRRFKEILENAVVKEIEIIQQERRKKGHRPVKNEPTTHGKGGKGKSIKDGKATKRAKVYKRRKRETASFPQIKMALSKPVKQQSQPGVVHKNMFSATVPSFNDPGWYPSDDEDDDTWTGPMPFYSSQETIQDMYDDEETSTDEESEHTTYQYETISGRRVTMKRPRLF